MLTMHHAVVVLENEPLITAQNGIAVKNLPIELVNNIFSANEDYQTMLTVHDIAPIK